MKKNIDNENELNLIIATENYTIRDGNKIKVIHEDYNKYFNVYLQVKFDIVKDVNKFKIQTASLNPTINKKYALNFVAATSPYEPKLIKNKEDFLSMTTGYYILGVDLELENYTPIEIVEPTNENNAQLIELDGNGRTITITSFNTAELTDAEMQVGLFKKIPNGTTIKNLNVRYLSKNISGNFSFGVINKKSNDFDVTEYFDLCSNQNINYTKSTFGGLAAANFGVVTNCNVFGEIAIRATTIEEKKYASQTSGGNYEIDFFVGGLVGVNESTGYITNSTNALRIFAQANIGGLVYENKGKIVSSAVDTYTDYSDITIKEYQPLLYNYNNALEKTIAVKMGGLAVINSGKISMSYVNFLTTELSNGGLIGNMSAKDVSAGFVYTNSGNISDAYVVVDLAGNNQNEFYGFVYQNTTAATIEYSFTYVNRGEWGNNSYMFTANSAPGINNCLEIVNYDDSYTVNSSNGLETVKLEDKSNRGVYESINLAFGDNKTAVWQMVSGQMPKLVSTLEKISYEDNRDCNRITVGDVAYEYYYGLKNVVVMEEYKFNEKGEYVKTTTETTDHSSYGTKENPILILNRIESNNISCWENYFTQENYRKYFRLVSDIDLSVLSRNPKSSTLTFSGNIQGNNMDITGYMLYTTDALEGIGLFKEIVSANDIAIESSVRNLNLTATSVWAAKTKTVGLLAGLVENYNLYNIHANAPKIVMVGGNAVGGVAGVVRGNFDIQRLSGNIGVNSTTVSSGYKYSVYMSKNNAVNESSNLDNVYYAGGVIAILDGYDNSTIELDKRVLTDKYFSVKDISVKNNIVALADTVGAAFGFVGERVSVKNIDVNLTEARISGRQYSAGAIGENRGVVNNVNVVLPNNAYTDSTYVVAGVVGLNAGGLVQNTKASFTCERNDREITIGGIIGRNIYGVVTDSISDAKIIGYYTGGIVGSNYKYQTLQKVSSSSGAVTEDCRKNAKLIPTSQVIYKANESATPVVNFKNTGLTINSLSYFVQNTNKFHTVSQNEGTFSKAVVYNRVLGLCIGLTDDPTYVINSYGVEGGDEKLLMFNAQSYNVSPQIGVVTIKVGEKKDIDQEWPCSNVLKISDLKLTDKEGNEITGTYMTYITGAVISEYDAWERNRYAADMLIITDQDVESPMWNISSNYYISIEKIEDNFVTDAATSISTRTIKYFYVIRNLVGTNNMTFDFSSLLETFESGATYKVDNVNSTDTSKTMSAVSNKYSLKLEGTAKVATGSPHTLIYEYEFTIV